MPRLFFPIPLIRAGKIVQKMEASIGHTLQASYQTLYTIEVPQKLQNLYVALLRSVGIECVTDSIYLSWLIPQRSIDHY